MTNALDELRELLDSATPGPWPRPYSERERAEKQHHAAVRIDWDISAADAALIVFLRNHAEDLLAVLRAAEEARNAIRLHNRGLAGTPGHRPGHWPEERRLSEALARLSPTSEEEVDE